MAIRTCWSFDDSQVLADRGLAESNPGYVAISATAPRNGAQSLRITGAGTLCNAIIPVGAAFAMGATLGFSFAYRPAWLISSPYQTPVTSSTAFVVALFEGTTAHFVVGLNASGQVIALRPSGTVYTGANITPCAQNTYSHWEIKYVCHDTTGSLIVKINEVEYLNVSGIDTRNGLNGTIETIRIGGQLNTGYSYADDLILWDTAGSDVTDWVGDKAVLWRKATGAGNYAEWTPSAGANWQNIDDLGTRDEDATYNASSTPGQKDSFVIEDIATGSVLAVQSVMRIRKDDAGPRSVRPLFRISSTDYVGATVTANDGYTTSTEVFHNDPSDSADWAAGDINGAEHGYEQVA